MLVGALVAAIRRCMKFFHSLHSPFSTLFRLVYYYSTKQGDECESSRN